MSARLEVQAHERDPDRIVVAPEQVTSPPDAVLARGTHRGPTYHALRGESPLPADERRFGRASLRGRGAGTRGRYVSVDLDTDVPPRPMGSDWHWRNSIGMAISTARLEGRPRSSWVQAFAADLSRHPDFLRGAAYLRQEFAASTATGRRPRRGHPTSV